MYGRYGNDQLGTALLIAYIVLLFLQIVSGWPLFSVLMTADVIWMFYRCFSRNIAARRRENDAFLRIRKKFLDFFKLLRDRIRDCRTHVYHKCPHCRAVLRLPRRRGEHSVRCPRCSKTFNMCVFFGRK